MHSVWGTVGGKASKFELSMQCLLYMAKEFCLVYELASKVTETKRFCSNCGATVESDMAFCTKCGTKIKTLSERNLCPNCRAEYGKDVIYCKSCGTKLINKV